MLRKHCFMASNTRDQPWLLYLSGWDARLYNFAKSSAPCRQRFMHWKIPHSWMIDLMWTTLIITFIRFLERTLMGEWHWPVGAIRTCWPISQLPIDGFGAFSLSQTQSGSLSWTARLCTHHVSRHITPTLSSKSTIFGHFLNCTVSQTCWPFTQVVAISTFAENRFHPRSTHKKFMVLLAKIASLFVTDAAPKRYQ